jgi:hypothetical protein
MGCGIEPRNDDVVETETGCRIGKYTKFWGFTLRYKLDCNRSPGARQDRPPRGHCHVNFRGPILTRSYKRCTDHARLPLPNPDGRGTNLAIRAGEDQLTAWMKVTEDDSMSRKDVLGLPERIETLHFAFLTSCRLESGGGNGTRNSFMSSVSPAPASRVKMG